MAASSLRYDGATMSHETRTGAFVYDGSPAKFHEWEFRTMVKWASSDEERRLQSLSTIIDGLRGEAALGAYFVDDPPRGVGVDEVPGVA